MASLGIVVTPEEREALKKYLQSGFNGIGIYQRLVHTCGWKGNAYHRDADGQVTKHMYCPQCGEFIRWIPLKEWVESLFPPMPNHVVQEPMR